MTTTIRALYAAAILALAALAACSPSPTGVTTAALPNSALPLSALRAAIPKPTATPEAITLRLSNCVAPVVCYPSTKTPYIRFFGYSPANQKVVVTPVERGYPYGYAVEFCAQKVLTIDGYRRPIGDELSECRNDNGFFQALDYDLDPNHARSTQSLVFFGDGKARTNPINSSYNSLTFPVFPAGDGLPQDRSYGFALNLHIHDIYNHSAILVLQWCRKVICTPLN